ncbi:unnamed protein product, partial [Tetraodon nigroviridis]
KQNGLLTLSVVAVVTGCLLGFMLRGTQLSTQVSSSWFWPDPAQVSPLELLKASVSCCWFGTARSSFFLCSLKPSGLNLPPEPSTTTLHQNLLHRDLLQADGSGSAAGKDLLLLPWGAADEDAEDAHPSSDHLQVCVPPEAPSGGSWLSPAVFFFCVCSLMSGLSSMESKACCRMGVLTVTYYLWTTFIAVVVGIVLVLIIKPGVGTEVESNRLGGRAGGSTRPIRSGDQTHHRVAPPQRQMVTAELQGGNMVPSNLIEATFQQYKTDLLPILKVPTRTVQPSFVYVVPDESDPKGRTVYLELTPPPEVTYKTSPGSSQQMNVLGIVVFSATMGLLLGRMGERGAPLINVCQCINECVMKIINAAVWYFPFGIIFLVAGKILDMQDPSTLGRKLGWYGITVLAGLFVHGLILLPLFYFILTKKNPFSYIRGLLQAMVIALATSSRSASGTVLVRVRGRFQPLCPLVLGSSATLPITMKCLLENCRIERQIARFVLPVGATINMDGTALYEAVAAIFIAQVNDYELDFGQLVTISITATAASIGAAGIPQAGLVTMVIVLTSVGLPPDDITLIVAIDWILDRFRTMINVLGDALAAGIIAHLCRKDFP